MVFGAANVAAITAGVDPVGYWSIAAEIWVVARILHGIFYISDKPPLRVLAFVVGLGMSGWIFSLAITA